MTNKILTNSKGMLFCLGVTTCEVSALETFYRTEGDWQSAVGVNTTTINWDDVAGLNEGDFTTIQPNRYAALPGSPLLNVDNTSFLYVGNPDYPSAVDEPFYGRQNPVSEPNFFSLNEPNNAISGPEGILTITFDTPVIAVGGWFLDVEGDYSNTGIKVNGQLYTFESGFPEASQEFMGVVSDTPFTQVEFHFSTNFGNGDGVMLDDVLYKVVPEPASFALLTFSTIFMMRRRGYGFSDMANGRCGRFAE